MRSLFFFFTFKLQHLKSCSNDSLTSAFGFQDSSLLQVSRLKGRRRDAEIETAQLSNELQMARDEAKQLSLKIEESNAKAMAHKLKLQNLLGDSKRRILHEANLCHYAQVMTELEDVKKQSRELRLDIASALDTKASAEREVEDSSTKSRLYSSYIDEIKEEIAIAAVEEALISLAGIEADRELKEVEARREAEADRFRKSMDKTRSTINDLHQDVNHAGKLQKKLAVTASDVNVLQNEIELIRAMEKNCHHNSSANSSSSLQSTDAELETAKSELRSLKQGGFQLMTEMDAVRDELQQVAYEKEQSNNLKKRTDSILTHLNHRLNKAMSKLEIASLAEKRTQAVVSNISAALQQMQTDIGAAKKETQRLTDEIVAVRMEIVMEERLEAAMDELKAAKASEAVALEKLRTVTESAMRDRATISALYGCSTVTISKHKQAAQASGDDGKKLCRAKKGNVCRKAVQDREPEKKIVQAIGSKHAAAVPRRSLTVSGVQGATKRAKVRRPSVSSGRQQPSVVSSTSCLAPRRRKSILLNLVRFLRGSK
ncbi:hypothetical protein BHM03_00034467 [Ensete ventricosum]|nr:hypothetical protein BHM03_00034467 [Ensete ventricosum]